MQMIKFLAHIFSVSLLILCLLTLTFVVPKAQARGNADTSGCFSDSPPPPHTEPADASPAETETAAAVSAAPYVQQAYAKASNTNAGDLFGSSIAISGDTLVVGAKGEASKAKGVNGGQNDNSLASAGAVYVFVRSNGVWSQQAYLKSSASDASDEFGAAVAISGDTIVVGAPKEDSNAMGVNGNYYNDAALDSGAVYVFTRTAGVWTQQAYIKASNTGNGDRFGISVGISDDTLVVGAPNEDSNATGIDGNQADNSATDSGAVYAFTRSGTTWSQQAYIKASNTGPSDAFGFAVGVAGNTIVAGAPLEDSNATSINGDQSDNSSGESGAAYAFVRNGNIWSQQAYLKASNTGGYNQFGWAVAISANTILVGAPWYDLYPGAGHVVGAAYVFNRSSNVWSEQAFLLAADASYSDMFGASVGISGNRLVVGAPLECDGSTGVNGPPFDNWSAPQSGAAYSFVRNDNTWQQQAYIKASNTNEGDQLGVSVAIYGNTLVAGAPQEDGNATGLNGDQLNNSMGGAGAAYIFTYIPTVISSLRTSADRTTASSVDFKVTFAEPMTGVDASDFVPVTSSGITGTSVLGVSGGPSSYTVTVNTGEGDGTLRLDVKDDDSILNVKNVPLGGVGVDNGNFVSGETYLVRLRTKVLRSRAVGDGWVRESTETSNVGGSFDNTADTFRLGDDAANRQYLSILDFDTSSLPETIVVTAATLKIKKQSVVGTNLCGPPLGVNVDLRTPFFGQSSVLAASDFQAAPSASVTDMEPPSAGDWYSSNIRYNYSYFNRTGSVQFKLNCYPNDNNNNSADYLAFYSGDATTVADRPALILEYYVPTPSVISSLPTSPSPTTASSVDFNVTFSSPMKGVDASDFVLAASSQMSAASVVGVSGGPSSYTVTVNTSVGSGVLRLDVKDDDSIRNAKNVPLGDVGVGNGDFNTGESYLVRPITQTFQSQAAQDGWVLHAHGNPNFTSDSTATTFRLGEDAINRRYCSFLHFDTASLPESIVITKAILKIKTQSVVGTNPFTKYEQVLIDIAKPFFGPSPALENLDHSAAASVYWTPDVPTSSGSWYSFLIENLLYRKEDFVNTASSTQFRLQISDDAENSENYMAFYSGDAPTASDRPALTVQYYIP